jgi:hypothetical protein
MKIYISIYAMVLLCCSCVSKSAKTNKESNQMIEAQNYKMLAQLFPSQQTDGTTVTELLFQAKLFLSKEQFEQHKELAKQLQYQVDSAFVLLAKNDTVWPSYVVPVANGRSLNPQFIVSFDRSKLSGFDKVQFKTAIKSLVTNNDSGVYFNLTKINRQYK